MLTLILGGARSGKSNHALSLCKDARKVVYIATATAGDDQEMVERISRHRLERPAHWTTVEEPIEVSRAAGEAILENAIVLVDCITIWISNLLWHHRNLDDDERRNFILSRVRELANVGNAGEVIAVSNEVGSGIVPDNPVGRSFRDVQGFANQVLAKEAGRVILMVAGLPLALKGG